MTPLARKAWIDSATYEQLLSRWRFEPVGSPWFDGEIGEYLTKALLAKRRAVGDGEHVRASKSLGWGEK